MAENFDILKRVVADFNRRKPTIMRRLATEAVNYSKQSFRKKGWDGKKWPGRAPGANREGGRALLADSTRMRNATRHFVNKNSASLINETPYASTHNQGGVLRPRVTKKMRGFAWAMYKKTKQDKWKGLALTKKKKLEIKIPQRKFMGMANELTKKHKIMIRQDINRIFKDNGFTL